MSPRIFIWINMATFGGATGHAMATDGDMLGTESGNHIGTVLNRLLIKTKKYWDKYPRGFTLEMIEIGEDPTQHADLCKAIALHRAIQAAKPAEEPEEDNVVEGGSDEPDESPSEPWRE